MPQEVETNGFSFPSLIYGTADFGSGKPEQLSTALVLGYRAVDTGNNDPYDEAAAGEIIAFILGQDTKFSNVKQTSVSREKLIIQAKYSPPGFFKHKQPPYNVNDIVPLQILKSFQCTLSNLHVSYIDVYFLHRPFQSDAHTFAAWEIMEEFVRRGGARHLGISQVDSALLKALVEKADIPPWCVQNYCCKKNGYDKEVRRISRDHGIVYQCFGLLEEVTAEGFKGLTKPDGSVLSGLASCLLAARRSGEKFCVLDGSRNPDHLKQNLQSAILAHSEGEYEDGVDLIEFAL